MRTHRSRRAAIVALALAMGLAACGGGGAGGGSSSARIPGASPDRIVRAELDPLGQIDAYRAIERLRPRWLRSRTGGQPMFYVDGARRGTLRDMRSFAISQIGQIEYLNAADASQRFGTGHQSGAILVTTRR